MGIGTVLKQPIAQTIGSKANALHFGMAVGIKINAILQGNEFSLV
jgi:hypothetical protein